MIFTTTKPDTWYLQKNTITTEATAAETVANIVHSIMKKYPNQKGLPSSPKEKKQATNPEENPSFFEKVFELARLVPKGRVTTYGSIAEAAGIRLSARMVGWAMHAAGKVYPPVPAHRVVNRNGMLTGKHHFPTPTLMEELLAKEGVVVKDDKVQRFRELLWTPGEPAPGPSAIKPRAATSLTTKSSTKKTAVKTPAKKATSKTTTAKPKTTTAKKTATKAKTKAPGPKTGARINIKKTK